VRERLGSWRRRGGEGPGLALTFEDGLVWVMYDMVDVKETYRSGRIVTLEPTIRPFSFRFLSLSVFVYSRPPHRLVTMSCRTRGARPY